MPLPSGPWLFLPAMRTIFLGASAARAAVVKQVSITRMNVSVRIGMSLLGPRHCSGYGHRRHARATEHLPAHRAMAHRRDPAARSRPAHSHAGARKLMDGRRADGMAGEDALARDDRADQELGADAAGTARDPLGVGADFRGLGGLAAHAVGVARRLGGVVDVAAGARKYW